MDKVKILMCSPYALPGIPKPKKKTYDQVYMDILKLISHRYSIKLRDIMSASRKGEYVYCRHIFCWFMREEFGKAVSYAFLSRVLHRGERTNKKGDTVERVPDHTTIMAAIHSFSKRLNGDSPLPKEFLHLADGRTKKDYQELVTQIQRTCL